METISFDNFLKLEIRIGKIISAEKIENSDKLLKLQVNFGPPVPKATEGQVLKAEKLEIRQIIAGIAKYYEPEALIGKECPFVYNLAPRALAGLESQGMILCPSDDGKPVLLHPDKEIQPGSLIK